ncbi:MAG TPA: TonB family protein [Candidatus Sulfotelmatobacter sp.]|nr:TonB family protein [Candidatus Sulfotelmatobacter sp.]
MKAPKLFALVSGALLLVGAASAQSVKVIANSSVRVEAISASDLKSVFLEEKSSLPGSGHVEPVLAKGGQAHEAFLKQVLGRSDSDLQLYYRSLAFTGRGAVPKTLDSDEAVVAYVAKTRGAIGYVSSGTDAEGVRTLDLSSSSSGSADRRLITRIEPDYPETLRQHGIGGTVRMQVVIAASGSVKAVELRGGNAALGEAAVAAVKKWKYAPAGSETQTEVSISFEP